MKYRDWGEVVWRRSVCGVIRWWYLFLWVWAGEVVDGWIDHSLVVETLVVIAG